MNVALRIIACLAFASGTAYAQHHHEMEDHPAGGTDAFGVGVALVAASFDTMTYAGNYQGVLPSVRWSRPRYGVAVTTGIYRLEENGAQWYGLGDLTVHGQATIVGTPRASAGVIAGVTAPIGDDQRGMGMGHAMIMPALFGAASSGSIDVVATAGYSRALGADSHHDHGPWPLVEPMLMSEISWSAGGDLHVTPDFRAGGRLSGGIPVGGPGNTRVVGALRAAWRTGRVESAAEIQAGLAGDPFTVRGVVSTALSF